MCGIFGVVARRDAAPLLLEGLQRLEYRGYDSAGIALINREGELQRHRTAGKVKALHSLNERLPIHGQIGIAHTRWATHGPPTETNAHPHISGDTIALVHNGIIENFTELRADLSNLGYLFYSETDSEVIAVKIYHELQKSANLREAIQKATAELTGAYAICVISRKSPDCLVAARRGSPLVIGVGQKEYFTASDTMALAPLTKNVIYLEDNDVAVLDEEGVNIYNAHSEIVERAIVKTDLHAAMFNKGHYKHYMLKEIFEQPQAVMNTLEGRIINDKVIDAAFGLNANAIFDKVKDIQIIACGTSYHAGLVARYWFESLAAIRCRVDFASEYRYRQAVISSNTLVVTISQSGETADTLAALQEAKRQEHAGTLVICNVPESALVRASDLVFLTRAGPEIGVASTKAFTTQLTALMLLVITLGHRNGLTPENEQSLVKQLQHLPEKIKQALALDKDIQQLAHRFFEKEHILFLGRGVHYPVALEGALKLKEISYIHAEAYPAGELKHGPLALVDSNMPVVAVAPHNQLLEKLKSNFEEVRSRGGHLIVFADRESQIIEDKQVTVFSVAAIEETIAPIVFTIPLQLLAYHTAVTKGTDIDQPRNLAKSVTVE